MLHQKRNALAHGPDRKSANRPANSGAARRSNRENLYTPPPPTSPSPHSGDELTEWGQSARKLADEAMVERRQIISARQQHLFGYEPEFDQVRASVERRRRTVEQDDEDSLSNSSVSFARSGCHSILSAWRLRANRNSTRSNNRSSGRSNRPLSVLSTASSRKSALSSATNATTHGKSPASASRIALGPKAAQHFVTNSKRRRRANELILNTLEARRRILEQQAPSELMGSLSYLAEPGALDCVPNGSLSPSPAGDQHPPLASGRRTPPPRPALSDLGSRSSPQIFTGRPELTSAAQEQRERVLREAVSSSSRSGPAAPRAKPDQNSSDLCSSVTSDDGNSSADSNSSGSQFTQLMSSELAPDCVTRLLDKTPEPAARRRDSELTMTSSTAPEHADNGRLRRGALRRDSIRRQRLNRSASQAQPEEVEERPTSTSGSRLIQLETLPKSRRLDIENNPFLNRHHFRTTSARGRLTQSAADQLVKSPTEKRVETEVRLIDSRWTQKDSTGEHRPMSRAQQASPGKTETNFNQPERPSSRSRQAPQMAVALDKPASSSAAPPRPSINRSIDREHASNSRQDYRFNSIGSLRHLQTSEKIERQEGQSFSRSLSREHIETICSTSISPPVEFADPPAPSPTRQAPATNLRRSSSEERPVRARASPLSKPSVAPRPPRLSPQPSPVTREAPPKPAPKPTAKPEPKQASVQPRQPELPKFESTADAEFRKRVDYLRRLARANLAEQEPSARSNLSSLGSPTTRPLSTNWSGSSAIGGEPRSLASWGRSSSSLAALGRPRTATQASAGLRPSSPAGSLQPQPATTPLRLVVRERIAPKLHCAEFVLESSAKPDASSPPMSGNIRQESPPSQRVPVQKSTSSPRSPDTAATSSNDDSAIASSLSSPSLSFAPQSSPAARNQTPASGAQMPSKKFTSNLRPPANGGTLQSILRRQQAMQGSQHQSSMGSDSSESSAPAIGAAKQVGVLASAPHPSGDSSQQPKRVHFNDRTSIRSFESISSLAESGSTAVAADNDLLRRQLGSPDSMNSASSTSRLSAESPDLRNRAGAAIYAVRGDPELGVAEATPPPPSSLTLPLQVARPVYVPASQPAYLSPPMPATIRMTAPPSIGVRAPPTGYQYPRSSLPSQLQSRASTGAEEGEEEEEDPSYVMRLRQAATRGVFNYSQPAMLSPPAGRPLISQNAGAQPIGQRRPAPVDLRLLNFQTEV